MFGTDPLAEREDLIRRKTKKNNPIFNHLFTNIVSSHGQIFLHALLNFKKLTERLFIDNLIYNENKYVVTEFQKISEAYIHE